MRDADAVEALERVRAAALSDPDLAALLDDAEAEVVPGSHWEASAGRVQGLGVVLALGAEALAELTVAPALRDALERACARGVASAPGLALTSVITRWNGRMRGREASYRSAALSVAVDLEAGVRAYVARRGAALDPAVRVTRHADSVTVEGLRGARSAIEDAVHALAGPEASIRFKT